MPSKFAPPSYRLHKARNCAVVTIHRKNHYLGPYRSPSSLEKYARLIADWRPEEPKAPQEVSRPQLPLSVSALILRYLDFSSEYYRKHGLPTGELDNIRCAVRPLKNLYGSTLASDFGPKPLELVRQAMIKDGLARRTINGRISRIKRMYR